MDSTLLGHIFLAMLTLMNTLVSYWAGRQRERNGHHKQGDRS